MIIIITIVVLFSLILTLSMCRVSSRADDQMEATLRNMMEKREGEASSQKEDSNAG